MLAVARPRISFTHAHTFPTLLQTLERMVQPLLALAESGGGADAAGMAAGVPLPQPSMHVGADMQMAEQLQVGRAECGKVWSGCVGKCGRLSGNAVSLSGERAGARV